MLTHFLDLLVAVISVTSLLIVTYGALIGIISFLKNEIRRFTGGYSITNIRKLRATFGTYLLLGLEFLIASASWLCDGTSGSMCRYAAICRRNPTGRLPTCWRSKTITRNMS